MDKKLWNDYKNSEEGKRVISLFTPDVEEALTGIENIVEFLKKVDPDTDIERFFGAFNCFYANFSLQGLLAEDEFTEESFVDFMKDFELRNFFTNEDDELQLDMTDDGVLLTKESYREKASDIDVLSSLLYFLYADIKPILFAENYGDFKNRCNRIGLEIPSEPDYSDYSEVFRYYYNVCMAMNDFQEAYDLTDAEMCACLYDFKN